MVKSVDPKATCKDRSTVDYFICSPNMIQYLYCFNVLDFLPFFSDPHCGIELKTNVNYCIENSSMQYSNITVKTIHWNSVKAGSFENNCDTSRIRDLVDLLDNLSNKTINKQDIDDVALKIEDLFEHACLETFGARTIKQKNVNKLSKPWFNIDYRNARNLYHITRRLYNNHKTEHYKTLLKM